MYNKVDNWFDIVKLEHKILDFWKKEDTFNKLREKNKNGRKWSFLDGPITANNPMGVHHAWGRSLKDVYQRYWAMKGCDLRYQNGFDCQGLWVEVEVEKELGFTTKKDIENYGIDKFIELCKERVRKYSKIQTDQSVRLGYWMEWDNSYYTMSDENNYTIWTFLKKCHEKGYIYKGHDVIPWCPRCGTGISQHEMQEGYKQIKQLSVFVRFPIVNREKEAFLVWTTTPWTLPANVALAVNPGLDYVKVKEGDWFYYIGNDVKERVLRKGDNREIVETLKGSDLIDAKLTYRGPFDDLPVQKAQKDIEAYHTVIPWKDVTAEEGTCIVHIAPGCGSVDFALGKEFNLPSIAPIDDMGVYIDGFDLFSGKSATEVNTDVIERLKGMNLLYGTEKYEHSYPHCWRCSSELLFRLVDEWFIEMDPWRENIKANANKITWIPSFGRDLELDWLTNMRDWMISKKRYWGLALPIWECTECNTFQVMGGFDELKEKAVEGWDSFKGKTPHRPWIDSVKINCHICGKPVSRIPDVGNPWLDAGIVPYSTVNYNDKRDYWKEWVPADLVLECFPGQFRNWFYSLLAMSTMMEDIPPFKTLVGHSLVRDEKGNEMHKSKGNAIWFDDAAEDIGVEVMRWMFFNQDIATNMNFGFNAAKLVRGKIFNSIWNSYGYFVNYARLIDFIPPETPSEYKKRPVFDRWILSKLQLLIQKSTKSMESFDVKSACRYIETFVEDLSNWYIRNNRRRYWRSEINEDTLYAYETLYDCLWVLIRILAPVLPMLTEEMYQNLVRSWKKNAPESIHLTEFPVEDNEAIDNTLISDMDTVIRLNTYALSAREKVKIKIRQPLGRLIISPKSEKERESIERFSDLLKENLNVKEIEIAPPGNDCPTDMVIRPNMKLLGPKFGSLSKKIMEEISKQNDYIVNKLKEGQKEISIILESGDNAAVSTEDLIIEETDPAELSIVKTDDGWLGFDTTITPELEIEGLMRDTLRHLQVMRKDIGLEIEDRIEMRFKTDSEKLRRVFKDHMDFICSELLCLKLVEDTALASDYRINVLSETLTVDIVKVNTT